MAVIKQRLYRKGSSGYDTIHLETSAGAVLMANGTTVENAVNGKAASNHSHSGYAARNHTHSGYASSSHSHSFSSISGNLTTAQINYIKSQIGGGSSTPSLYKTISLSNFSSGDNPDSNTSNGSYNDYDSMRSQYTIDAVCNKIIFCYPSYSQQQRTTITAGSNTTITGAKVTFGSDGRSITIIWGYYCRGIVDTSNYVEAYR